MNIIQTAAVWESDLLFWEVVISAVMETPIRHLTFNMQLIELRNDEQNYCILRKSFVEHGLPCVKHLHVIILIFLMNLKMLLGMDTFLMGWGWSWWARSAALGSSLCFA